MEQKIFCKFTDFVLAPRNAFPKGGPVGRFETLDGVLCETTFVRAWNNTNGGCDFELDDTSNRIFGHPFSVIRSIWIGRLGNTDEYWYLLKMNRI